MAKRTYKPGQNAPRSGQYEIVKPSGKGTGKERTVRVYLPRNSGQA